MKKILFMVLLLAIVFTGCVTKQSQPPVGCEDSVIYQRIQNPVVIGTLIQVANMDAIKQEKYKKEDAIEAIKVLKLILEIDQLTFSAFLDHFKPLVDKHIAQYGLQLLLLNTALSDLYIDVPMNQCDKDLLVSLCDKLLYQLQVDTI